MGKSSVTVSVMASSKYYWNKEEENVLTIAEKCDIVNNGRSVVGKLQ